MLASLTRTKTFWVVVVVLLGYGIITWDDDDPRPTRKPDADDKVNVVLEISMFDPKRDSIQVAVAASLGSAGRHADRDSTVWDGTRFPDRPWQYRFKAHHGDEVNAEVANRGAPVVLMVCHFLQQGQGSDVIADYGDITGPHLNAANGGTLARCAAVVR